ncbi:hypothetical protein O9Z70_15130 [Devosia sp. YIM 151766]|uniref:COG4223 family protein n=1 Tax=Devosia sp. YIM 151766 TaxID=3017325 RepID=UPI00255CC27B|nr:hypothetical protein [Devosia sp. YIM 151766]WIY52767.1 hypothetical protein O9Z70_15130 [Devosia sp. YIM 151766]
MADNPGKDTPPTDPKAQDKTGPVRPPILEGTARAAPGAKPADASVKSKPQPTKPSATTKPREPDRGSGAPWIAGILGGAIGLGAAYGLAWFGLWPSPAQTPPPDPRLAQFATAIPELQTTTGTLQSELATLGNRVGNLQSDIAALPAPGQQTDIGDLAERLADLSARFEALPAGPAPGEGEGQNAAAIAALETQLAELRQEASETTTRLADNESRISALAEAASASASATDQTAQLPLIFSSLESAFLSGRPYTAELAALRRTWPETSIPEMVAAAATGGLPRPDEVARRLNQVVPDMLAGRPANAGADWQDGAMDWLRGIVAMRPAGEIEGDGPEAIVTQLEAAMARRDFRAAQSALSALPAAMSAAAGPVADDIAALAEAEAFLASLRSLALGTGSGA